MTGSATAARTVVFSVLLLFPSFLLLPHRPAAHGRPDDPAANGFRVEPPRLDLGRAGHGESPSRMLRIENTSGEPLRISELATSCGCTHVEPPRIEEPVPPGEAVEVRVRMSSGRILGTLSKHVEVRTNRGTRKVPVVLRVFPEYRADPLSVRLAGEVDGRPVTESVEITRRPGAGDGPVRLRVEEVVTGYGDAARPDPHMRARVEDTEGGKRLRITVRPTRAEGRFIGEVRGRLDGERFVVAFSGEMFRGIRPEPPWFRFDRVEPQTVDRAGAEVVIRSIDDRPFRILGSTVRLARKPGTAIDVEVRSVPRDERREYRLIARLRVPEGATPRGGFTGEVVVRTDHPEKPEMSLRLLGFFPTTPAGAPARESGS